MSNGTNNLRNLTDILRQDYKFALKNLVGDSREFWSRTFIKTTVSLVEAEIFNLKQDTLEYCNEHQINLSPEQLLFLNSKKYEIASNGDIKERLLQVRLKDDIKFSFNQIMLLKRHELKNGYDDIGWSNVISTIAVRNRLTHPKSADDLVVAKREESDCKLAFKWFINNIVFFLEQDKSDVVKRYTARLDNLQKLEDKITNEKAKST